MELGCTGGAAEASLLGVWGWGRRLRAVTRLGAGDPVRF